MAPSSTSTVSADRAAHPQFHTETCRRAYSAWIAQRDAGRSANDRPIDIPDGLDGEWKVIEWLDKAGGFALASDLSAGTDGGITVDDGDDGYSGLLYPTTDRAMSAYKEALSRQTPHLTFRTHHAWRGEFVAIERLLLPLEDVDGKPNRLLVAIERIKVGADERPPFVDDGTWLTVPQLEQS